MTTFTTTEIVKKLIGKISPVGETNQDSKSYENLKRLCDLVDDLVIQIEDVSKLHDSYEFSVKRSGEYAKSFLKELKADN